MNIPDAAFKNLLVTNNNIDTDGDDEINFDEAWTYTDSIIIPDLAITDFTGIEAFKRVSVLKIRGNNASGLDLRRNIELKKFSLQYNFSINTIIFLHNDSLEEVSIDTSIVTCLDFSTVYNLKKIRLNNIATLTKLNLKNGNNAALDLPNCNVGILPSVFCIQVDNASISNTTWTPTINPGITFSDICSAPTVTCSFTYTDLCDGDVEFLPDTTGMPSVFNWDFGDGGYTNQMSSTINHTYTVGGGYYVDFEVRNCFNAASHNVYIGVGQQLSGLISTTTDTLQDGYVVLYRLSDDDDYEKFDSIANSPISITGGFYFPHVINGEYLIKAFPNEVMYPDLLPTFYGDKWRWNRADTFFQVCVDEYNANIVMQQKAVGTGIGTVSGFLNEGVGFGRAAGDPIRVGDVKLGIQGTGLIRENGSTDINGFYELNNLPFGDYFVYIDVPGLRADSADLYHFTLDATTPNFPNLNYLADSVHIFRTSSIGIEDPIVDEINMLSIYPNPVIDFSSLEISVSSPFDAYFEIHDILGRKIYTSTMKHYEYGKYLELIDVERMNLRNGVYSLSLIIGNKKQSITFIVNK